MEIDKIVLIVHKILNMSDYKLGFESINNIGPGGNFLVDDMTMELLKSDEFFESPHFDMSGGYDNNAKGIYEMAHQANELVSNYKPTVPMKVQTAIKDFFRSKYNDKTLAAY